VYAGDCSLLARRVVGEMGRHEVYQDMCHNFVLQGGCWQSEVAIMYQGMFLRGLETKNFNQNQIGEGSTGQWLVEIDGTMHRTI
jgi:hypothetical protein